jgi:hypothetical protein
MWRIVGPLLLGAVIAAPAAAAERARIWENRGNVVSVSSSTAVPPMAAADRSRSVVAPLRAGFGPGTARQAMPPLAAAPQPTASPLLPWLGDGLALPLSKRLSLGVDYENIRGEDLWREFAETGSPDYDSHNFLLRAQWRF